MPSQTKQSYRPHVYVALVVAGLLAAYFCYRGRLEAERTINTSELPGTSSGVAVYDGPRHSAVSAENEEDETHRERDSTAGEGADSPDPERESIAQILMTLTHVEVTSLYHDVVEKHLDSVMTVMEYLQRQPEDGFELVHEIYQGVSDPGRRGLLVFIACAARECPKALDFFRKVLRDCEEDAGVRLACVYGLAMANLPVVGGTGDVRWHFATVLWAIGNMLGTTDPRDVYTLPFQVRAWPAGKPYGWQGGESRLSVLQMVLDAFAGEPCPKVRYAMIGNVCKLSDEWSLADFWMRAYASEDWTIPEGCFGAGTNPVRNNIAQSIADSARELQTEPWLGAVKSLYSRVSPWGTEAEYLEYILEVYEKLGWLDLPVIEHALLPFTRPELGNGQFPYFTLWAEVPLRNAAKFLPPDKVGELYLRVVETMVSNAGMQHEQDTMLLASVLSEADKLTTEQEIYRLILSHPTDPEIRSSAARSIDRRAGSLSEEARKELIEALVAAREKETNRETFEAMEDALEKLSPGIVKGLPPKEWPPKLTWDEQIDGMLRRGDITFEAWQSLKESPPAPESQGK